MGPGELDTLTGSLTTLAFTSRIVPPIRTRFSDCTDESGVDIPFSLARRLFLESCRGHAPCEVSLW
jgi:hypothetical protein